jgi:hypothetical protein
MLAHEGRNRSKAAGMERKSLIERAIELAQTGAYERIDQIERQLSAEGYSNATAHLDGPSLRRQLNQLGRAARGEPLVKRGRPPSRDPAGA